MLVNLFVCCTQQICDFGLARVAESDPNMPMTHEVVTQYYRAPEILMGARHYTAAVDMWSVGCIVAELLSRRILFQAQTTMQQVNYRHLSVHLCVRAHTVFFVVTQSDAWLFTVYRCASMY